MAITAQSIVKDINKGNFSPIYFLQGEEPYYIDLISDLIPKKALQPGESEFNQTIVYGKDADVATILNHARRFPMMAERQVVIVKEAQQISDLTRENGKKLLEHYAKAPVPTTVLVFCYKNKKFDSRTTVAKAIAKNGVMFAAKKIYENQVPTWIDTYLAERGASISPKASILLTEYIGNNLERLVNELNKILINFEGGKVNVDENLVQQYVGINKEYNIFELQKSLLLKDREKSFRIIRYFISNPKANPAVLTIFQLYSLYSKLLLASEITGGDRGAVASALKVNPYFVNDYISGLRNYNIEQIVKAIHYINVADGRLKGVDSGSMNNENILNELIYRLLA